MEPLEAQEMDSRSALDPLRRPSEKGTSESNSLNSASTGARIDASTGAKTDGTAGADTGTGIGTVKTAGEGVDSEAAGEGVDAEADSLESAVRIRRADADSTKENHYVLVIHGTFDAPPADGLPTWYQMPAPNEQNFCSKVAKLLDYGSITGAAVWRALPCDLPADIPYPFHWDGSNTHEGRVDAATKVSHKSHVARLRSQVTSRKSKSTSQVMLLWTVGAPYKLLSAAQAH